MSTKETDHFCPSNKADWRKWLSKHHHQKESIWLIIHKQNSSNPNLSWSEAVDQALCFGWIDGIKKPINKEKYMHYFCKRKDTSTWSKINKNKVEQLISKNLMMDAGFESIKTAKQNGSWNLLDDVEALLIPEDLEEKFRTKPGSKEFFQNLNKSTKKGMLQWIVLAKQEKTRQKRIQEIVDCASANTKPKLFR